jgi:hypothetical protein
MPDEEMNGVAIRKKPEHQAPPDEARSACNRNVHGSSYCTRNAG